MVLMVERRGRRYNSNLQVTRFHFILILDALSIKYVTSSLSFFRELGIGIVAYSPLGRGFFASGPKLVENLDNNDVRKASTQALYDLFD